MTESLNDLLAATVFFVAGHFLLSSLPVRQALTSALERVIAGLTGGSASLSGAQSAFRGLYSVFALITFVWMLQAYGEAPVILLWDPPPALAWAPALVMPVALFLAVAGLTTGRPTLVGGEARLTDPSGLDPAPGVLRITRHPFLWGSALWAASHLAANGEAPNVIVMGGILVLSLGGMRHIDRRREATLGAAWGPMALTTSAIPFAALASGRTTMDWAGIGWWRPLVAVALYAVLLHLHPAIFGVPALPPG